MIQYGLMTKTGLYLPRDAYKRGNGLRLITPDLWQDKERANELAEKYSCEVKEFTILTYVDRNNRTQPGHA